MNPQVPPPNPYKRDSSWFRPGMTAPASGLYRIHHYAHRMSHTVIVVAGTAFPRCKGCGDMVQFAPLIAGEPIESDRDLAESNSTAA